MSAKLTERLNQILPKLTSPAFLTSDGIGNEIACYVFDYAASEELIVRAHLDMLLARLESHHGELKVLHLNLLDVCVAYLQKRGFYKDALAMAQRKGDAAMLKELRGVMSSEKIAEFIQAEHSPADKSLVIVSGVGSVWPMLRAHGLLNTLHTVLGRTPLVMFYPGAFDGTTLRLFGQIAPQISKPGAKPYNRAFQLVPGGTDA